MSWRSDPRLVAAINALFEHRPHHPPAFLLDSIAYPHVEAAPNARDTLTRGGLPEAPFEVLFVRREADGKPIGKTAAKAALPQIVAAEVSALLRSGSRLRGEPIRASDVAILTRTNNQCFEIQDELRALGIPAVVIGDKSVFESNEATELQRVLGAVAQPGRAELRKALATELLGVSANDFAAMEDDPTRWDGWASLFAGLGRTWTEKGFVQMFDALLRDTKLAERVLGFSDGERRMTNVLHLMELLWTATKESHLGPSGVVHWLAQQRSDSAKRADSAEIRLESDEAAVTLTTIHKSKGLEYPIVYCPYLWDGSLLHPADEAALTFHDTEDRNRIKLDLGSASYSEHKDRAELETLAENVRLLYVALTRAKHRCTIVWGGYREVDTSALFSVLHPPALPEGEAVSIHCFRDRLRGFDDDALLSALAERAKASGGAIGIRFLDGSVAGEKVAAAGPARGALHAREPVRSFRRIFRMTSFSALASGQAAAQPEPSEGRDHDEEAAADERSGDIAEPAPIVLAEFARGTSAGTFYHSLLEHLDFRDPSQIEPVVRKGLHDAGYDEGAWAEKVARSVRDVLETPLLAGSSLRLADVPASRRLNELEFHLPVADRGSEPFLAEPITRAALSRLFAQQPSPEVPGDYSARVGRLRFVPVEGFLKGYIDLVFEHEGRFYVVDYKTNFLGPSVQDYGAARLSSAMAHGHYYLQYHLYTLAVHRYLERRVKAYRYEEHFGGALYLFVRGMTPERGPSRGVFFEKPPWARIVALSNLVDGGGVA